MTPARPSARRPPRVLVVEDEALVAADLESRLSELGYELCGVADTAKDAVELARTLLPDVVLMDIHLIGPGDGIEAADRIRLSPGSPVVFATAHADHSTVERAGQAEPFGYVIKPYENRDLRVAIETALYRHRAETRFRQMEQWVTSTLAGIGDGLIATSAEGQVKFINDVACLLTGWSALEAFGRPVEDIFRVLDQSGIEIGTRDLIAQTVFEGVGMYLSNEHRLLRRDGTTAPIDHSIAPVRSGTGAFDGAVLVFRDSSARRGSEQMQLEMDQRLRKHQQVESIAAVAGGMAEEFGQRIALIRGNLEMATRELEKGGDAKPFLRASDSAAHGAAEICQQFSALAGRLERQLEPVDVALLARDCFLFIRRRALGNVQFDVQGRSDLPKVSADLQQLRLVLLNLLGNACEALEGQPGLVSLTVGRMNADRAYLDRCDIGGRNCPAGEYLFAEVKDDGVGMPPESLARLFSPFFSTKPEGRGLGLACSAGVIRQHGGAIQVHSELGVGSSFRVLLPLSPAGSS